MTIAKIQNCYNSKRQQIFHKHSTIIEFFTIGDVRMDHVKSEENLVYLLTKGLSRKKVFKTSKGMRLDLTN